MASRAPTVAQRQFAQQMALGKSKTQAYALTHPNSKMKGNILRSKASLASKSKAVQAELERLLAEPLLQPLVLEACAAAHDPVQIREHAVAVMLRLSRHTDAQVAFHAAVWLASYADALEAERAAKLPPDRKAILAELSGLYAKALNRPAIVETVAEPEEAAAGAAETVSGV